MSKKYLKDNEAHRQETHYRWLDKVSMNRPGEAHPEQCFACRYYIELSGRFQFDWGACSNPKSPYDGRVVFEHDGCEFIDYVDDEEL